MRPVEHEVVSPDVVLAGWPKPDTTFFREPKPAPFGLLLRHFKPFAAPDLRYTLVIDVPTFVSQQGRDSAIAVSPILGRQIDDLGCQCILITGHF